MKCQAFLSIHAEMVMFIHKLFYRKKLFKSYLSPKDAKWSWTFHRCEIFKHEYKVNYVLCTKTIGISMMWYASKETNVFKLAIITPMCRKHKTQAPGVLGREKRRVLLLEPHKFVPVYIYILTKAVTRHKFSRWWNFKEHVS